MYVAATKRLTHQGAKHMAAVAVERAQIAGAHGRRENV
jgi:hypothetical protein